MESLRRYESHRGTETLGILWTLTKDARTAACILTTHPLGWELTVTLNGELVRSEVRRTDAAVLDTSTEWRKDWEAKGWAQ